MKWNVFSSIYTLHHDLVASFSVSLNSFLICGFHILRGSQVLVPHIKDPLWHFIPKIQYHYVYSPKGDLGLDHIIILGGYAIISWGDPCHFKWYNGSKYHNFWVHGDQELLFWGYFHIHTNLIQTNIVESLVSSPPWVM